MSMHSLEYYSVTPGGWQQPDESPLLPDAAREVVGMMESVYACSSFSPPWIGYMVLRDNQWIGTCAFKSPPKEGRVEIAYFTFPGHEGQGIGGEMAAWLVATARRESPETIIFAQTLPEENASTRILRKNGFVQLREVHHPEDGLVREWELRGMV